MKTLFSAGCQKFDYAARFDVPKDANIEGLTSLRYALRSVNKSSLRFISENWDTSNIIDFEGCFQGATFDGSLIMNLDYSHGITFEKMFENARDTNDFRDFYKMDCSRGINYRKMFYKSPMYNLCDDHKNIDFEAERTAYTEKYFPNNLNYENISKIKVNPKGNFSMFFRRLPKNEAEHFRNWFPDMDIVDIIEKLTTVNLF